ncbi:hypothetical protein VNI00_006536 [Paramarasmius palmivorus]|uniref:DUF3533 domain-containing protein n=1 Tax=Paramarasmius palmivorus TaxID=297713 RepID=A0AAW0D6Z0_9AGAR
MSCCKHVFVYALFTMNDSDKVSTAVDAHSVHSSTTSLHNEKPESTPTRTVSPQMQSTFKGVPPQAERPHVAPFSASFLDKNVAVARKIYLKVLVGGTFAITIAMFAVFSIYWGALWKSPAHNLHGWIVDFDGSSIGTVVSQAVAASSSSTRITWQTVPPSAFPGGVDDISHKIVDEKAWVAIVINSGATEALNSALASADAAYNGSAAITVYGVEARNENAFRSIIRPTVQGVLESVAERFAQQQAQQVASASNLQAILTNAPQIITRPISYTINNLRPFDIPV